MHEEVTRDLISAVRELGHFISYSEEEAAERLGVSTRTLQELRLNGEIRYTRVAKKGVRYLPQHLYDYAEKHTQRV